MVIDTSALLAVIFNENDASRITDIMQKNATELRMSTVNLAECMILIEDKQPQNAEEIIEKIMESSIRFVPPSVEIAMVAAQARLRYPLNLGDCFAYALAKVESCPILTLDKDFKKTDVNQVRI